jgi:hypothetical protein
VRVAHARATNQGIALHGHSAMLARSSSPN